MDRFGENYDFQKNSSSSVNVCVDALFHSGLSYKVCGYPNRYRGKRFDILKSVGVFSS